ncbi:MAG: hypothetical protein DHS20C10_06560 [marine bacterium B5-7]|nr:MAG: hypothetical protein DHS20C10_06560 [marine bacterium B5-7]
MKKPPILENLLDKLCDVLPNSLDSSREQCRSHMHDILQGFLKEMHIVTREEFDRQRDLLDQLLERIASLEKSLRDQNIPR